MMRLDFATVSERGGRTENQDACGQEVEARTAFFVVCDGAGGHHGGALASRLAVDETLVQLRARASCSAEAIEAALRAANEALVREQKAQAQYSQMRATIVALAIDLEHGRACWGHLGDSRVYCFRERAIVVQTRDHSVVQTLVDAGYLQPRELRTSPDRSKLLCALGDAERFEPALVREPFALARGDKFLLCTDGLWEYVQESEMEESLAQCASPKEWLGALEKYVLARGRRKHDNYSAIAIWYG